jgi:hypothetical protein
MFRIGTAAVVPPQPPVPSDGYHSGYSSGNERADPRTSAGSYSFAPPTAADPQWQHHVANAGGIVGIRLLRLARVRNQRAAPRRRQRRQRQAGWDASRRRGLPRRPRRRLPRSEARTGEGPTLALGEFIYIFVCEIRLTPCLFYRFPGGTDPGYPYADRRMGAGAGVVPTPAYPTAYPVAATPPPVVPLVRLQRRRLRSYGWRRCQSRGRRGRGW